MASLLVQRSRPKSRHVSSIEGGHVADEARPFDGGGAESQDSGQSKNPMSAMAMLEIQTFKHEEHGHLIPLPPTRSPNTRRAMHLECRGRIGAPAAAAAAYFLFGYLVHSQFTLFAPLLVKSTNRFLKEAGTDSSNDRVQNNHSDSIA